MKNLTSTVGVVAAAAVAIGMVTLVNNVAAQTYTNVSNSPEMSSTSSSGIYTKGGFVTSPQTVISSNAVTTGTSYVATPVTTYQPVTTTVMQPTQVVTAAPTFGAYPTGPAAIPLGPVAGAASATTVAMQQPMAPTAQPAAATCQMNRQALPFANPTISFRGVTYQYTPTPPLNFANGAAVAAIYPVSTGQAEICYSGACISGPAGTCDAIGVAQPGGTVRVYTRGS